MARSSHIASVTALINIAVGLCSLLWIYNIMQNGGLIAPNIGIWLALMLVFWLLNVLFLRKARSIVAIVLLNVLFAAIQATTLCVLLPPDIPAIAITMLLGASIVTSAFTAYFAVSPIFSDHLLPIFEISFVAFVFMLWLKDFMQFSNIVLAPLFAAMIFNMLALVLVRVCTPSANGAGQSRIKGATVLLVVLLVIVLMVAIFSLFLAAPIGDIALKLMDAVVAAFKQLMLWLNKLLVWIMTLFGWEEQEEEKEDLPDDVTTEDVNYHAPPVEIGFVIIFLMLAGLVYLIYKLRHKRFSLKLRRPSTLWLKRFFNDLGRTFREMLHSIVYNVQSLFFNIFRSNTLQGLYYSVERRFARIGLKRGAGETPHKYLLRLAESAAAKDAGYSASLQEFALLCDKYFYSREQNVDKEYVLSFRSKTNTYLKKLGKNKITK